MDKSKKITVYVGDRKVNFMTSATLEPEPAQVPADALVTSSGKMLCDEAIKVDWPMFLNSLQHMDQGGPVLVADIGIRMSNSKFPRYPSGILGTWTELGLFGHLFPVCIQRIQPQDDGCEAWIQVGIYNRFPEGKNEAH